VPENRKFLFSEEGLFSFPVGKEKGSVAKNHNIKEKI